jgi:hypothetical protein
VAQKSQEPGQRNGWTAGYALREESPTIVRHLADGCPTCNAGLQALHHTEADAAWAATAVELFEKELAASLAAADSPVEALHSALADLAVRREHGLSRH